MLVARGNGSAASVDVSLAPGDVRLLDPQADGRAAPIDHRAAELPEGAVRPGLQAPNLPEVSVVAQVLQSLADGSLASRERKPTVSVLIPDAAVRMTVVPLQGVDPSRAESESMARWALRDVLPAEGDAARVDWSVVSEETADPAARWLVAIGAEAAVVKEYESVVESVGWTPGRVVPFTLGLAVGVGSPQLEGAPAAARLVLSGVGDQVACLVEADGVPRLHRAWRGAVPDLTPELRSIQRYADQRLGLSIVEVAVAGPEEWRRRASDDCEALGWKVHERSSWAAHIGAVQP